MNRPSALYVHIPFCKHICTYCDFPKLFYNKEFCRKYMREFYKELRSYKIKKVKTIYVGGGTPTALGDRSLMNLIRVLSKYLEKGGEFTVEANVENLTESKLKIMKKYGVNRLSIGIQSSNPDVLAFYNRNHTFMEAINVVWLAKDIGFDNINVDMIYGDPITEKYRSWYLKTDLENILSLDVDHISIYELSINEGTVLYNLKVKPLEDDIALKNYKYIVKTLRKHGYKRYEVSNFARNGKECEHNKTYWKNHRYYGVGLGASGFIKNIRYTNTYSLSKYLAHKHVAESEVIDKKTNMQNFLLTNFRMEDGFKYDVFNATFKVNFQKTFKKLNDELVEKKLLALDPKYCHLTDKGIVIMDSILRQYFDVIEELFKK